jgi:hypothetical protein
VEALLWVKNLYVTARKSWSFVELPNKLAIIKDVIKSAKTVTGAFTNNLKEVRRGSNLYFRKCHRH